MNHYCPNKFYAHIAQGLILEAKVLDEMILDPGAEVMNVDRMPSPSSAPARRHDDHGGGGRNLIVAFVLMIIPYFCNDNATTSAAAAASTPLARQGNFPVQQATRTTTSQQSSIQIQ